MKRSVLLITFLLMTSLLMASYRDALKLFKENKFNESLRSIAQQLKVSNDFKKGSDNYKLRYLAAHNHWKLGNPKSVILHLKKCMEIRKDTVKPYIDLSLYMIDIKNYPEAWRLAEKGLKIKKDAMLYYILGKISLIYKKYWNAKAYFEKANSLNQTLYVSYNDLGISLMRLQKFSEANAAFTIALALNPKSSAIQNNMGLCIEYMGENMGRDGKLKKFKQALNHYSRAYEISSRNVFIKENLARIKARIAKLQQGI